MFAAHLTFCSAVPHTGNREMQVTPGFNIQICHDSSSTSIKARYVKQAQCNKKASPFKRLWNRWNRSFLLRSQRNECFLEQASSPFRISYTRSITLLKSCCLNALLLRRCNLPLSINQWWREGLIQSPHLMSIWPWPWSVYNDWVCWEYITRNRATKRV